MCWHIFVCGLSRVENIKNCKFHCWLLSTITELAGRLVWRSSQLLMKTDRGLILLEKLAYFMCLSTFLLMWRLKKYFGLKSSDYDKVNRCLARYSLRATTINWPTNRAPKKTCMAWPISTKNANFGPNLVVLGQKILFFYLRNQKFCYLYNGKLT